jgi:serine protease Do
MKNFFAKTTTKIFGFVLLCTIVFAVVSPDFLCVFAQNTPKIGADSAPVQIPDIVKQFNTAVINASNSVVPSVVFISVESERETPNSELFNQFHKFFDIPEGMQKVQGAGSGVIITQDGYIITNNHVVDGATKDGIKVILSDKSEYKASVIGTDPSTDLAVIKIEAKNLKPAFLGDVNTVKVGDFVIAVGNPLGLNSTVTQGIISAIGRGQLGLPRRSNYTIENYIQTDAAINPGNSGGGLFDLTGSLIGINTAIATENGGFMGYGFAVPIDIVRTVALDLMDDGKIDRPVLGVMIKDVDEIVAKSVGLEKVQGVLVNDVVKNSASDKAGVESQDVILTVNGNHVNSVSELQGNIVVKKVGDKVKLKLWRNGKEIEKYVTLQARTEDLTVAGDDNKENNSSIDNNGTVTFNKLGFTVAPLSSENKDNFDVTTGVYIKSVDRNSTSSARGLTQNGVILYADRQEIKTTGQLKKIIDSKKSGEAIMFKVKYSNANLLIAVEIP